MDFLNSGIFNIVAVIIQGITAIGWFVFIAMLYDKRSYLSNRFCLTLTGLALTLGVTLMQELISSDFIMNWNLPNWYVINAGMLLCFFRLLELIEKLKDENKKLK